MEIRAGSQRPLLQVSLSWASLTEHKVNPGAKLGQAIVPELSDSYSTHGHLPPGFERCDTKSSRGSLMAYWSSEEAGIGWVFLFQFVHL